MGQEHRSQHKRRDHSVPPVCSETTEGSQGTHQTCLSPHTTHPHPNPHHVTTTQGVVGIPRAGTSLSLG